MTLSKLPEDYYYSSAKFYLLNEDDLGFISHCEGDSVLGVRWKETPDTVGKETFQ